jgi:SAM-dependent methyltransferase
MNENHPCALCGEDNPDRFRVWFDSYIKLYRCQTCDFIAQFPGPGKNTIISSYEHYFSLDFTKSRQKFMYPKRRRVLQDIADRIQILKPKAKILDVGCGDGHFLYLCSKLGMNVSGVEYDRQLSAYAGKIAQADVKQGEYTQEVYPKNSFDVITFIQVVEHLSDPIKILKIAHDHLRPGGLIVLEIPSISAPHFLAYRLTGIKRFVNPPAGIIDCHFGYYSPKTIQILTQKSGFETVSSVTGRWHFKYHGLLGMAGQVLDPFFNLMRIGGILYIGKKT